MWFKRKPPQPPRRRNSKTLGKRLAALLKDADTYVFGGLAGLSSGTAVILSAMFGTAIGIGGGLTVAGFCTFGLGVWLLPPRRGSS